MVIVLAFGLAQRPDLGIECRFAGIEQRGDPFRNLGWQGSDSTSSAHEERDCVPVVDRRLAAQKHAHSRKTLGDDTLPLGCGVFCRYAGCDFHGPKNGDSPPSEICFV
jgi:hypothetical protein